MALLKQSNYIPLKDAMQVCEENMYVLCYSFQRSTAQLPHP